MGGVFNEKTQVWAHRGTGGWDRQYAPENSETDKWKSFVCRNSGVKIIWVQQEKGQMGNGVTVSNSVLSQ